MGIALCTARSPLSASGYRLVPHVDGWPRVDALSRWVSCLNESAILREQTGKPCALSARKRSLFTAAAAVAMLRGEWADGSRWGRGTRERARCGARCKLERAVNACKERTVRSINQQRQRRQWEEGIAFAFSESHAGNQTATAWQRHSRLIRTSDTSLVRLCLNIQPHGSAAKDAGTRSASNRKREGRARVGNIFHDLYRLRIERRTPVPSLPVLELEINAPAATEES